MVEQTGRELVVAQEQHIHLVLPHDVTALNWMEPQERNKVSNLEDTFQDHAEDGETPRSTQTGDPNARDQMAGCDGEEAEDARRRGEDGPSRRRMDSRTTHAAMNTGLFGLLHDMQRDAHGVPLVPGHLALGLWASSKTRNGPFVGPLFGQTEPSGGFGCPISTHGFPEISCLSWLGTLWGGRKT